MPKIEALAKTSAPQKSQELLSNVEKQLGSAPNIFLTFAHSPVVLEAYLQYSGSLAKGKLPARLREQIAVAVAGQNQCDYCASAHTFLGEKAGLATEELNLNLCGNSQDQKTAAVLAFVTESVEKRGRVNEDSVEKLISAGFSTEEVVEIIGHIGLNIFTNYFNHIADTEIDFPLVSTKKAARC